MKRVQGSDRDNRGQPRPIKHQGWTVDVDSSNETARIRKDHSKCRHVRPDGPLVRVACYCPAIWYFLDWAERCSLGHSAGSQLTMSSCTSCGAAISFAQFTPHCIPRMKLSRNDAKTYITKGNRPIKQNLSNKTLLTLSG